MSENTPPRGFLGRAYNLETTKDTSEHYHNWAATYEQELAEQGYVTPQRCAKALSAHVTDLTAPVLDAGCGTGLSGVALQAAGFTTVDGFDYSQAMLNYARSKAGVYRKLGPINLMEPLPFGPEEYTHACAAGVINPGHAPMQAAHRILDVLPGGGCLVMSLNDHAREAGFSAAVEAPVKAGLAELVFEEEGEHIPGIGLRAIVYVLRKR